MSEEKGLIKVENLVPEDIFKDGGIKPIIDEIKLRVEKENIFDITTPKGRKETRSLAAKVAKSKTFLESIGKNLKDQHQKVIKPIDGERRFLKDELDALRDEIKKPVEEWEAKKAYELAWDEAHEENIKIDAERQVAFEKEYSEAWELAHDQNELFDLRRENEKREAEQRQLELEKLEKEKEERIKKEAAEKAKAEAEAKIQAEREEKERLIAEAKQREEQAKIDAENAEKKRLQDIEDAKIKAEKEKQDALEEQKRQQQIKESNEAARLEYIRRENERKAKNLNHRKAVNNRVLKKLTDNGMSVEHAKEVMEDLINNPIPEISINYGIFK